MKLEDLDQVVTLEEELFPDSPWTKANFEQELCQNPFGNYFVIEKEGQIVAYSGLWIIYERAEITTIGCAPNYQRKHLAETLMRHMDACANQAGCETISLEVRQSNLAAQALYKKLGYIQINVRKKYYATKEGPAEDALLLMKAVGELHG